MLLNQKSTGLYLNSITQELYKIGGQTNEAGLRNKRYISWVVKELEKEKLIIRKRQNNTTLYIQLTLLGQAVAKLVFEIERYCLAYSNLASAMKEKILFLKPRYLGALEISLETVSDKAVQEHKTVMRVLGWKEGDVQFYNECRTTCIDFKYICDINFLNIILLRYAKIHQQFSLSKGSSEILMAAILKFMEEKSKYVLINFKDEIYGFPIIRHVNTKGIRIKEFGTAGGISKLLEDYHRVFVNGIIPAVVYTEIKEMMTSYLTLLNPPIGILDYPFEDFTRGQQSHIDSLVETVMTSNSTEIIKRAKEKQITYRKLKMATMQLLVNVFEEYKKIDLVSRIEASVGQP
jgi:hypothetical protein